MLVVEFSCFAIHFPPCIFHSDYLPKSLCLGLICGTCQITLVAVYRFLGCGIFRWWCTWYIVYGYLINRLAHRCPFRCTDCSWTMKAQVNPRQQEVKSCQLIALHLSILGDIVDSESHITCLWIISDSRWSSSNEPGKCWLFLTNSHSMRTGLNLNDPTDGNSDRLGYWFQSGLNSCKSITVTVALHPG